MKTADIATRSRLFPDWSNKDKHVRDALLAADGVLSAHWEAGGDDDHDFYEPLVKVRTALAALRGARVLYVGAQLPRGQGVEECWLVRGTFTFSGHPKERWFVVLHCGLPDAREYVRDEMPTYAACKLTAWPLHARWYRSSPAHRFVFTKE